MTHTEFRTILNNRITQMQEVLDSKAREYASDTDRLHNFKEASSLLEAQSPGQAVLGMLVKHWVSVQDLVLRDAQLPIWDNIDHKLIDEKIGDAVNYLVLLEAILKEKA